MKHTEQGKQMRTQTIRRMLLGTAIGLAVMVLGCVFQPWIQTWVIMRRVNHATTPTEVEAWAEKIAKEHPVGTHASHGELTPPGWPYEVDVQVGGGTKKEIWIWIYPKTKGGTTVIVGPAERPVFKGNPVILAWGQRVWFVNYDTLTRRDNRAAAVLLAIAAGCGLGALAFGKEKETPSQQH